LPTEDFFRSDHTAEQTSAARRSAISEACVCTCAHTRTAHTTNSLTILWRPHPIEIREAPTTSLPSGLFGCGAGTHAACSRLITTRRINSTVAVKMSSVGVAAGASARREERWRQTTLVLLGVVTSVPCVEGMSSDDAKVEVVVTLSITFLVSPPHTCTVASARAACHARNTVAY
jgi:hypothetical protein